MEPNQKLNMIEQKLEISERNNHFLKQAINFVEGTVYWKDCEGIYLGHNDSYLKQLVDSGILQSMDEKIIGHTDYDFFSKTVADEYRNNDIVVITSKEELLTQELSHTDGPIRRLLLSRKLPLLDNRNNVAGVIGNTLDFSYIDLGDKQVTLTQRELQTYASIFMGMTAKAAAYELNLSKKTIEGYIMTLKKKLNCYNKHQMVQLAMKNNLEKPFYNILKTKK